MACCATPSSPRPELQPAEFFVDPDIARAESLPDRAFFDPAFLDLELSTIFSRNWLLLPERSWEELRSDPRSLSELLTVRGAYLPITVLDRPLFLQRDWEGQLHCHPNLCTHAWYPLVQGPGRERTIVCRQHGRRFDSRGRYLGQPGFEGVKAQDRDHLADLPLAAWWGFLFTSLQPPGSSLETILAEVDASLGGLPREQLQRRPREGEVRLVAGNWKQHAWNYMDVFHLTYIHRAPGGLADTLEMETYRTELYSRAALQWAYAVNPEDGFEPDLLPARFRHASKRVFALWWFVYPNLTLNFYPWGLSVNVYTPVPGHPEQTLFLWYHYVLDDARYARRDEVWLNRQVDAEDVDAIRQVSRGVSSGLATRGRFAPGQEAGPHWFHRLVFNDVFESSGRASV